MHSSVLIQQSSTALSGLMLVCAFAACGHVVLTIFFRVEILSGFLKQILAHREAFVQKDVAKGAVLTLQGGYETPLKEVKEIVVLPELNRSASLNQVNADSIVLPMEVSSELHKFIRKIAQLYNPNPCMYITQPIINMPLNLLSPQQFITSNMQGMLLSRI
jgi:hypothetical protein